MLDLTDEELKWALYVVQRSINLIVEGKIPDDLLTLYNKLNTEKERRK